MTAIRILVPVVCILLAACETSGVDTTTSYMPRQASYRCSEDVSLSVRSTASGVMVNDSRGIQVTLPASPPGQTARYSEGIYTLVIEGGDVLWYVLGKTPIDGCHR